tara:strand:- start:2633 stop:2833 length:201 start_codon:yes stop_codon:yes gene_type:complete
MTIRLEILVLLSPNGFEDRFHHYCRIEKTNVKAYEEVEKEYEGNFGKRRYASYDSFRVVMSRKLKK